MDNVIKLGVPLPWPLLSLEPVANFKRCERLFREDCREKSVASHDVIDRRGEREDVFLDGAVCR